MNLRLTFATLVALTAAATSADAVARVHHGVHRQLQQTGKVDIVVTMKTKPTEALKTLESTSFPTRGQKIESVVNQLDALSVASQKSIDAHLTQEASTTQSLYETQHRSWALNARFFNGATIQLVEALATMSDVESIREQEMVHMPTLQDNTNASYPFTVQWGVDRIQATKVWQDGIFGQNVVVGTLDTGVRATHKLLRYNKHEPYYWYDAVNQTAIPFDQIGHGTHVMGIIAGAKGYGVAPGAKWMACHVCSESTCPQAYFIKCAEFMTCPTDTKGNNKDCSKAPHVVNNSWGSAGGLTWFKPMVDTWQAVGIIPVFAQGNFGPDCGSALSPGDFPNVIAVGATSINETLVWFSSRGPAVSGIVKPDLSAPGYNIISASSTSDDGVRSDSGTSMATPHVTGSIALLLSAEPNLKYQDVYNRLTSTTDRHLNSSLSTGRGGNSTCGGIPETVFPNNHYGYGRVNVFSAYKDAREPRV